MRAMFEGASAFNQDIGGWNTTNVSDMHGIFKQATSFDQDISQWDTSNVKGPIESISVTCNDKDIGTTFNHQGHAYLVVDDESIKNQAQLDKLEQGQIRFCTSHVTKMDSLFKGREHFNADISDWDTSEVWNMREMFKDATTFNQPIGNWDTSKVEVMYEMFNGASAFNQPIGNWDTSKVGGRWSFLGMDAM
ncbi:BspA family leucine-rich repeat surface protein, partial [Vibrio caribbeanicus]